MQKKTRAVLLIPLCLTACHQTTNRSTAKDEILTGSYIDPTKTRFPLADYSQSVDKWIPPTRLITLFRLLIVLPNNATLAH